MGQIVLLDDATINKIAAGEVIERPASAIKEIMENSIDAGATSITVEIKNGGISYIRVTDNGKGIMPDDMVMAFERHATSKLRNADELSKVMTMGFRGEALASIAAISKVTLTSKVETEPMGYEVIIEGGRILKDEEAGCANGTSITIENLFFNTPVRYKFLKKDFTESGYIEDAVTRLALVHPEIAIKLINTGKTIIQTPGNGDIKSVIYNIYGNEIAQNLIDIEYEYQDYKVKGVIGKPSISRANRAGQLFFVNSRFVKDKTLTAAAEQAFKDKITFGRHGFLILNIQMDPSKVDVNVHPAKLEVRFQNESDIFHAIYHAIKNGLEEKENSVQEFVEKTIAKEELPREETLKGDIPREDIEKENEDAFADVMARLKSMQGILQNVKKEVEVPQISKEEEKLPLENNTIQKTEAPQMEGDISKEVEMLQPENNVNPKVETEQPKNNVNQKVETEQPENNVNPKVETEQPKNNVNSKVETEQSKNNVAQKTEQIQPEITPKPESKISDTDFMKLYEKNFGLAVKKEKTEESVIDEFKPVSYENVSIFGEIPETQKPVYKYIGTAFGQFITIEMQEDLYIINYKAIEEKIIYNKIKECMESKKPEERTSLMLLPDVIELDHRQMGVFRDNKEFIADVGLVAEEFGENSVKLSSVPEIIMDYDTQKLFIEILEEINKVARNNNREIELKIIETIAKKTAENSVVPENEENIKKALDKFLSIPNPFVNSNGETIAIKMTKYDIEKQFSRIQ